MSVLADDLDEATETFTVGLSDATGATIGASSTFTRTIVDADAEPTISIAGVSVVEGQSGMQNAIFTVSLSAASGQDVTVTLRHRRGHGERDIGLCPGAEHPADDPGRGHERAAVGERPR